MAFLKRFLATNGSLLTSPTLWINLIGLLIMVAGSLSGIVPPTWQPFIAATVAVLNIALRVLKTLNPSPTPDPNVPTPEPPPTTELLAWLKDLIESLIRKEVPPVESKALALKMVADALDEADKAGG